MKTLSNQVIIVTGASSGFGKAIAEAAAAEGAALALCARRQDRLESLRKELQAAHGVDVWVSALDVRDTEQVRGFVEKTLVRFERIDVLINNAGLALGRNDLVHADEADWQQMMDTNVMGVFRFTQAVLPFMLKRKSGHIVNIGSIAGHWAYEGGAGYCGSKFAVAAMSQALRLELVGKGVKVTSVDPGLAETEFSEVRFKGDRKAAREVYAGMQPLTAQDVAECVLFALSRPPHVNIDDILLTPLAQGGVHKVHRHKGA